jgi:hypothetical protein
MSSILNQVQAQRKACVIYHKDCVDGFASAWAFHTLAEHKYPGGVDYIPMNYGEVPHWNRLEK